MKTSTLSFSGTPGRCPQSHRGNSRGFTLIEMIGVLAILAVAAAMVMPALVSQTDSAVASAEVATLQSYAAALQNNIMRNRTIPSATNWIPVVATEMGQTTNAVTYNIRGGQRILLVDTNGFAGTSLPYVQSSSGAANPVTNSTPPRFMIVSSLGTALPAALGTNQYPKSADFNALWNTAAGAIPTNSGGAWTGWTGSPSDIYVQRIDLAYLFTHLVLNNNDPTNAQYRIDSNPVVNLSSGGTLNAWYLTTTVLSLYLANTNMEAEQILLHDCSWTFSGGGWRTMPAPAVSTNLISTVLVSIDPCDSCRQLNCQIFCTNTCNPWSGTYPSNFCNDMSNCMSLYMQYASTGFTNHTVRNQLQSCCSQINNNDIPGLCQNHY